MSELQNEAGPPAKPRHRTLIWAGGIALIIILLVFTITMSIQAFTRSTMQHPQDPHAVLAVINNSGSTNTPAYTLTINQDGSGSLIYQKGNQERFKNYVNKTFLVGTFPSAQLATMLTQINDVSTIPNHGCMKSISFGTTTTITYQGKTSGDLSCLSSTDPKIFQDVRDLVQSLYARIYK